MRRSSIAFGIILGFAMISLAQAEPKPFPDLVPAKLKVYVGGFIGSRLYVELDNGDVHVRQYEDNSLKKVFTVRPTLEAWTKFVEEINRANLYKWATDYPNKGVYDGTQWSVELEFDGRKFKSKGDNNYPTAGAEAQPTNKPYPQGKPFETYCAAVSHLIGEDFN